VGWVPAATGWAVAAFFGEKPCKRTFGSIVSAIGVVAAPWRRAIWERSGEEGVEGTAEAVVVETLGGDVPEEVGGGGLGPGGDVDQGGRLAEACREEEAEDAAVGELQLRVGWQVAVDDVGDAEALEERGDEGQGSEGAGLVGDGGVLPGEGHRASSEKVWEGWRPQGSDLGGATPSYGRRQVARNAGKNGRPLSRPGQTGVESGGRSLLGVTPVEQQTGDHHIQGCGK